MTPAAWVRVWADNGSAARLNSWEAPWRRMRILVDRFIYQGLGRVPRWHAVRDRAIGRGSSKISIKGSLAPLNAGRCPLLLDVPVIANRPCVVRGRK